jgi:integrase
MAIFKKQHKRTGVEFYYIRFHAGGGKWKKERAGTTLDQAKKLLKKRCGEVVAGTYVDTRAVSPDDQGPTFTEFAERFQKDYSGGHRSNHYAERLKALKAHFGDRLLRDLRRKDFDLYRITRGAKIGPSTLRKELTVLGTLFRKSVEWEVLEASPAVKLEKPPEPLHRTRYLTVEEWRKLEAAAPVWLRPIITLGVLTGMRLKELLMLRWEDWDREKGQLFVSEENKTGRPRTIPLSAEATGVLQRQVRRIKATHVFVNRQGKPYLSRDARQFIGRRTKRAMVDVGIKGASFHTLRHTAGSWMAQAGDSEVKIAKILGHASTRTTERYTHLETEHLRGTVDRLGQVLRPTVPQTVPPSQSSEAAPAPAAATAEPAILQAVRP